MHETMEDYILLHCLQASFVQVIEPSDFIETPCH